MITKFVRLYRDADPDSGGGLPPSLEEIDVLKTDPPSLDPDTPPKQDDPPADEPVEGLDADGNLLEGYKFAEDGKTPVKVDDKPADEPDDDDLVTPEDFWNQVETITGNKVEVDYGDTDPLSPEGVAIRERVIQETAQKNFDQYIRETYPRAYAYFLHVQEGLPDEEFFSEPAPGLVSRDQFEQDPDIQSNWLMKDFLRKGIPEDIAQATIDKYIKDNQLKDKAMKLYEEQDKLDRARLKAIDEKQKQDQKEFEASLHAVTTNIAASIKNEMKLLVPEVKQKEFQEFVINSIRHDGEKFFVVHELGDKLSTTLDSLYLQFMKGDLNTLVEKRAQTKAVQRLGQRVAADKKNSSSAPPDQGGKKFISLADI